MIGRQDIAARVIDRKPVVEGILELVLAPVGEEQFPDWEPGAHIDLILPQNDENGDPLVRQYSLCGDPANLTEYRLGILRDASGRGGSAYVHDQLSIGNELTIGGPRNHFPFQAGETTLFIAGGIGITPILPMVRKAIALGAEWTLIVAARNRARLPFLDDLAHLPQDRIRYHCDEEVGLLDLKGILGPLGSKTTVYSCGPAPLLDALQTLNADAPWHLRIERFASSPVVAKEADRPFEVICKTSGKRLHVPAGKSILQILREAGIKVESSCRDGVCGTCELKVISGTPCHRDSVLTPEEREEGTHMMVCVSRAKTDVLELDV